MKRIPPLFGWSLFLALAGFFLLMRNLGALGPVGDMAVSLMLAVLGLAFLVWFLFDRRRWWRVLPGFTVLGAAALSFLESQEIPTAGWGSAIVIFGVALGFWAVLLAQRDNWWAVIPAGTLTVIGVLTGLKADLSQPMWQAALFAGLGLVFALLYLVREEQNDMRWGSVPSAALFLIAVITVVDSLSLGKVLTEWWPLALVLVAVAVLIIGIARHRRPSPVPVIEKSTPDYDAIEPAPGASVISDLPPVSDARDKASSGRIEPTAEVHEAEEEPVTDIYKLLEQQPSAPESASSDS